MISVRLFKVTLLASLLLFVAAIGFVAKGQTVAPLVGRIGARASPETNCRGGTYCRYWLPLNRGHVDIKAIQSFFNSGIQGPGPVTFLGQVQYLYGFGGSTNSISSDMVGATTGFGLHVALGTTVTASPSTVTQDASVPSPAQAIQELETGGDLYVRGIYPILNYLHCVKTVPDCDTSKGQGARLLVVGVPLININPNGFGGQSTITEATEYNWNASVEANYQYPLYADNPKLPVSFYLDGRTGYQGVQGEFARQVGLGNKLNFGLTQFSGGLNFAGFMVGFQKFIGPAAVYGQAGNDSFNKWHLVIQFSPNAKTSQ